MCVRKCECVGVCVRVKLIKSNTHYKLPFETFTSHTSSDMMANVCFTDAGTQMMVCLGGREVGTLAILALCTQFGGQQYLGAAIGRARHCSTAHRTFGCPSRC